MEQKVKEKIDLAIDTYREKSAQYDKEAAEFLSELFTKDIWEMIRTIADGSTSVALYDVNVEEYGKLRFYPWAGAAKVRVTAAYGDSEYSQFRTIRTINKGSSYDSSTMRSLERCIEEYNQNVKYLNYVKENAEDIIETIAKRYKNLTETQTDAIDKLLADLDADFEPTKHIKVTVEWV